jgi:hypothetical protein
MGLSSKDLMKTFRGGDSNEIDILYFQTAVGLKRWEVLDPRWSREASSKGSAPEQS